MIDMQTVRVAALNNRVPGPVLALEVIFAAVALGLLAFYLAILGRGVLPVLLAAGLIVCCFWSSSISTGRHAAWLEIPATPLTSLRDSMELPPRPLRRPGGSHGQGDVLLKLASGACAGRTRVRRKGRDDDGRSTRASEEPEPRACRRPRGGRAPAHVLDTAPRGRRA